MSSMASVMSQDEVVPAVNPTEMSLPLTFFDIAYLFFPFTRFLMFYRLPISRETFVDTIIPKLVSSLSLTLKHYLPLAGNLVSPSDCSTKPELRYLPGDSVSVTFAESGGDFDSLTAYHPRDVNEFYAFVPRLAEAEHRAGAEIVFPVLAVQVTVFPGFGICIGITNHHVVGDANTMNRFAKAWAMISKVGGDAELIAPFYDRTGIKDPYGAGDKLFVEMKKEVKVVAYEAEILTPRMNKVRATFIMRRRDIEKLKNLVSERARTVHVSAFTVTCAYVWSSLVKAGVAIGEQTEEQRIEVFGCASDCRSRLDPPLPATYFGNCIVGIHAKSKPGVLVGSEGFLTAAQLIGEEIQKRVNDEDWIFKFWLSEYKEIDQRVVGVSGYPRIDLYTADFGWGKPEKLEFVSIDAGNAMSLCKCRDGEGDYEVGLAMPPPKMDAFAAIFADGLTNL